MVVYNEVLSEDLDSVHTMPARFEKGAKRDGIVW